MQANGVALMNSAIENMRQRILHLSDTRSSCVDEIIKNTEYQLDLFFVVVVCLFFNLTRKHTLCNQVLAFFHEEIRLAGNLPLTLLFIWRLITTGGN